MKIIWFVFCIQLCSICLVIAGALMMGGRPWWSWTIFLLMAIGYLPRVWLK